MDKEALSPQLLPIAAQLLAGMLANPHIYSVVSDEGASGRQEKILRDTAIEMAKALLTEVENCEDLA